MNKKAKQILAIIFSSLLSISSFSALITTPEEEAQAQQKILKMHTLCRNIYPAEEIPQASCLNYSTGELIDDDIQNLTKNYKKGFCRQFSSYYLKFLTQEMNLRATFLQILRAPVDLNVTSSELLIPLTQNKILTSHTSVIYELMPDHYFVIDPEIQDPSLNCLPIEEYFKLQQNNFNVILLFYFDANLYKNPNKISSLSQTFIFNKFSNSSFEFQPFSF